MHGIDEKCRFWTALANGLQHFEAVDVGQFEVEDEEIESLACPDMVDELAALGHALHFRVGDG